MIEVKFVEIRDRATFIPAMAIRFSGNAHYLVRRAGYGHGSLPVTQLTRLSDSETHADPFDWCDGRTMRQAHLWLHENWDLHGSGDVLDVEFILGEVHVPKQSESVTSPY